MNASGAQGNEALRRRHRVLYALFWKKRGLAYVGQTVDPDRRKAEHAKGWDEPFDFVPLGAIEGTRADGEEMEYAYRWRAYRAGWTVVAKTREDVAFVIKNPGARMNGHRHGLAKRLTWPKSWRRIHPLAWLRDWLTIQAAALACVWLVLLTPIPRPLAALLGHL